MQHLSQFCMCSFWLGTSLWSFIIKCLWAFCVVIFWKASFHLIGECFFRITWITGIFRNELLSPQEWRQWLSCLLVVARVAVLLVTCYLYNQLTFELNMVGQSWNRTKTRGGARGLANTKDGVRIDLIITICEHSPPHWCQWWFQMFLNINDKMKWKRLNYTNFVHALMYYTMALFLHVFV